MNWIEIFFPTMIVNGGQEVFGYKFGVYNVYNFCCFFVSVRHGECTQTDVYVRGTVVCVRSEVSVWLAGWADLPAAGQHLDGLDARPLRNSERQPARWLPVRTSEILFLSISDLIAHMILLCFYTQVRPPEWLKALHSCTSVLGKCLQRAWAPSTYP